MLNNNPCEIDGLFNLLCIVENYYSAFVVIINLTSESVFRNLNFEIIKQD